MSVKGEKSGTPRWRNQANCQGVAGSLGWGGVGLVKEDCPQLALLQLNPLQPMKAAVDAFEDHCKGLKIYFLVVFIFSFLW